MFYKLTQLLDTLEDPKHPCLGPLLRAMAFFGLWHPDLTLKSRLKLVCVYIIITFFFTQYIKCVVFYSSDSINLILHYAPFHIGILKICSFQKNHKVWEDILGYISSVEQNQALQDDKEKEKIAASYIRWSRVITYSFLSMGFGVNFFLFSEPYLNQVTVNGTTFYPYMFDGYTPFSREPPGYYAAMFIQTVFGYILSLQIQIWDLTTISIMIFFSGQLQMSSLYCTRVIDAESPENSQRNIIRCHMFHTNLVLYQRKFNALISSVMFSYLVTASVNLGVCIKQIAELSDLATLLANSLFLVACLTQLLLIYWHTNQVTLESERVSYSTLKCAWPDADYKLRRQVLLLAWTTRTRLVFNAGPFTEMTLTTFVAILRRSYSFYTLMNGTN